MKERACSGAGLTRSAGTWTGLPAIEGIEDALHKDGGVDPAWLAWAIDQIEIVRLPGVLTELDLAELAAFRQRLRTQLLDRAGAPSD